MDVQALIDAAGGVGRFASALGVKHSTVCDWKRTGLLPGARVPQISRTFDIPAEKLMALVAPPRGAASQTIA